MNSFVVCFQLTLAVLNQCHPTEFAQFGRFAADDTIGQLVTAHAWLRQIPCIESTAGRLSRCYGLCWLWICLWAAYLEMTVEQQVDDEDWVARGMWRARLTKTTPPFRPHWWLNKYERSALVNGFLFNTANRLLHVRKSTQLPGLKSGVVHPLFDHSIKINRKLSKITIHLQHILDWPYCVT